MQLTGSKKILGGLALAVVMALAGVGVVAQQTGQGQDGSQGRAGREGRGRGKGFEGDRGGFPGRFAEKLNLTDAQKEQMRQIAARFRESTKALRQQERGRERDGFDAFKGGTFDEAAVRAAAQQRANAQVEFEVARARMMYEMYNVLTPEQKAQLAQERQQREQKRQEWRARRNSNNGQTQQ